MDAQPTPPMTLSRFMEEYPELTVEILEKAYLRLPPSTGESTFGSRYVESRIWLRTTKNMLLINKRSHALVRKNGRRFQLPTMRHVHAFCTEYAHVYPEHASREF